MIKIKSIKFLIILLITFILTSCYNYKELNELNIVTGMTIEQNSNNMRINLLIKNTKEDSSIISMDGNNIENILFKLDEQSNKKIYLDHINFIIVNSDIIEKNIDELINFVVNKLNKSTSVDIYLGDTKDSKRILEILNNKEKVTISNELNNINTSKTFKEIIFDTKYNNFIKDYKEEGITPIINVLTINDKELRIEKGAILNSDNKLILVNKKDFDVITFLKGKTKEISLELKCNNDNISVTLEKSKINYTVNYNENPININLNINLDYYPVYSVCKNINIDKSIKHNLDKKINETIDKLQKEYKADIMGIGNHIKKSNPKYWKKNSEKWFSDIFPNLKFNIKTDIKFIK